MEAKKKYVMVVVSLVVALVASLTAMIIVLVVANQNATSAVNVKYTASEVYVELSAKAYYENTITAFTSNGLLGGDTTIELSPNNTSGSLSQPNSTTSIELNKIDRTIVFEYIFKNMTDDINCKIELTELPAVQDNIDITYYYSNTKIDSPLNLTGVTERKAQLLNAYSGETTYKYIYIIASIDDLLYDSSLEGNFAWGLSRPNDEDITTYTLNVEADYVERVSTSYSSTTATSTMEIATIAGETVNVDDIDIYPAKSNKTFVGWSYAEGGEPIANMVLSESSVITNKVSTLTSTTLYPVYKEGSIPASSYSYSNGSYTIASTPITSATGEFYIPDVYNNGTNGVAKVTTLASEDSDSTKGILNGNTSVTKIMTGRYLTSMGQYAFYGTTNVTEFILNSVAMQGPENPPRWNFTNMGTNTAGTRVRVTSSVTIIPQYMFFSIGENNITELVFDANSRCETLGSGCLNGINKIEQLVIPASVKSIYWVFYGVPNNVTSIILSEGITTLEGNSAFAGFNELESVTLPSTLKNIPYGMFISCSMLNSLTIPENVTSIGSLAFSGCSNLTSIEIKGNISSFGSQMFEYCSKLETVEFSGGVETLTYNMFAGLSSLKTVTLPSNLKMFEGGVFQNCTSLESITIPRNVQVVPGTVFTGCTALTNVYFANNSGWQALNGFVSFDVTDSAYNAQYLKGGQGLINSNLV